MGKKAARWVLPCTLELRCGHCGRYTRMAPAAGLSSDRPCQHPLWLNILKLEAERTSLKAELGHGQEHGHEQDGHGLDVAAAKEKIEVLQAENDALKAKIEAMKADSDPL